MTHLRDNLSGLSILFRLGLDRVVIGGSVLLALTVAAQMGGV